jgi:peptidyl-prolyl cis-trans isomerase SurA
MVVVALGALLFSAPFADAQVQTPPETQEPTLVDGIAAIVGNEVILKSEVALQAVLLMQQEGINPTTATPEQHQEFHEQALLNLVDDMVLVAKAHRDTIEVERSEVDAAVNARIEELKQSVGGEEGFQQALLSEGLTEPRFRDQVRDQMTNQLLRQKLIAMQGFNRPTAVSRSEAADFISERGAEVFIILRHILLIPPAEAAPNMAALSRIERLRELIVSGQEDFASVARRESEDPGSRENGGEYEPVQKGYWTTSVDSTVWNTETGVVSQPVRSEFGWHLVEVMERDDQQARMRHILIQVSSGGAAITALSETVSEVRAAIDGGALPATIVERFSEAENAVARIGYYRLIAPSDATTIAGIPQSWYPALQSIEEGNWEGPLESPDGVHFIQRMELDEETAGLVLQYDFPAIERTVQRVRQNEAIGAWLEALRGETYIEIKKNEDG